MAAVCIHEHISDYGLNSLIWSLEQGVFVGYFYNFFSISLCIRTDSLLQEKSDTLCVARYIKCVKLFFKGYTNRLEIADNDITIHSFKVVFGS